MKFHKNLQIQQKNRFLLLCGLEPEEPLQDGCRHINISHIFGGFCGFFQYWSFVKAYFFVCIIATKKQPSQRWGIQKKPHAFGARILFGSKHLTHLEGVLWRVGPTNIQTFHKKNTLIKSTCHIDTIYWQVCIFYMPTWLPHFFHDNQFHQALPLPQVIYANDWGAASFGFRAPETMVEVSTPGGLPSPGWRFGGCPPQINFEKHGWKNIWLSQVGQPD